MKKTWIKIRSGLLTAEHKARIENNLWLYLHIIDRADWETGKIFEWNDRDAADHFTVSIHTIRKQRRALEAEGYISSLLRPHCLEITVHNWIDPRRYDQHVLNEREGGGPEMVTHESDAGGDTEWSPGVTMDGHRGDTVVDNDMVTLTIRVTEHIKQELINIFYTTHGRAFTDTWIRDNEMYFAKNVCFVQVSNTVAMRRIQEVRRELEDGLEKITGSKCEAIITTESQEEIFQWIKTHT